MNPSFYRESSESSVAGGQHETSPQDARANTSRTNVTRTARSRKEADAGLPVRFAFGGELGDLLLDYLRKDSAAAQLSAKFKLYYRLRPYIPIAARQLLQAGRNRKMEVPQDWYVPAEFHADFLRLVRKQTSCDDSEKRQVIHPWPDGFEMSASLTHDVETKDGVALVEALADVEEEFGFRSAWNFIPHKYSIDPGLIASLQSRGHEVGVHGFNHDGRLFESRDTFTRRVTPINLAISKFGSTGFRAPMVHRNLLWLQDLNIDYDASVFDVDPFQAMPGGVGGCWPFFVGKFVELPYTLPQDHTLLIALGETEPTSWIRKLEWLKRMRGMAMLVTHPDYLDTPKRLDVYRRFLETLAEEQESCWVALPNEIASWWRQRDGLEVVDATDGFEPKSQRGTTENSASAPNRFRLVGSAAERASLTTIAALFADVLSEGDMA